MDLELIESCLDAECALWDWARTAGVSAAELREWNGMSQSPLATGRQLRVTSDVVRASAARGKAAATAGARSVRAAPGENKANVPAPAAHGKHESSGKPAGSPRADAPAFEVRPNGKASPRVRSLPPANPGAALPSVR